MQQPANKRATRRHSLQAEIEEGGRHVVVEVDRHRGGQTSTSFRLPPRMKDKRKTRRNRERGRERERQSSNGRRQAKTQARAPVQSWKSCWEANSGTARGPAERRFLLKCSCMLSAKKVEASSPPWPSKIAFTRTFGRRGSSTALTTIA